MQILNPPFWVMRLDLKVKQIEAVELADGKIQVRREIKDFGSTLTVEVKSEDHYLKASTWHGEEVRNLFYFIKPIVEQYLKRERNRYMYAVEDNQKELEEAKNRDKNRVWDFKEPSRYGGKINGPITIKTAEKMLEKQRQKVKDITAELKILSELKTES